MGEGDAAKACPKFEASQKADPSPGTLINLAGCYKTLGRTASAWAEYKSAETLARNLKRSDQQEFAAKAAAELEPNLSKLELVPPKTKIKDLQVTRDGELIDMHVWSETSMLVAGYDQSEQYPLIYSCDGDCYEKANWTQIELLFQGIEYKGAINAFDVDGDHVVAVGEKVPTAEGGFILESFDRGVTWTDISPEPDQGTLPVFTEVWLHPGGSMVAVAEAELFLYQ